MSKTPLLGHKVRRLRMDRSMSQVQLAERLGISSSYLNLIEHNQRNLTVHLLLRISAALNVSPQIFATQNETKSIAELTEILKDPMFEDLSIDEREINAIASEHPSIGVALSKTYNAFRTIQEDYQNLNERLSQDSLLATNTHRLRTLLTSIVSFSEILHDNVDLPPHERQNFLKIVLGESENLTQTVNTMVDLVSGEGMTAKAVNTSPNEAVTDFMQAHNNYFDDLEVAAQDLRREAGMDGLSVRARLISYLMEKHGVSVEIATTDTHQSRVSIFDQTKRHLVLSMSLSPPSVNFHLTLLIGHLCHAPLLERLSDTEASELTSPQARLKAQGALANYFAGACLLPYDAFLEAAEETRYDLERLQHRFNASFEQIAHRLVTLRRPGAAGIPMHFVRVDMAGNISKRFSASGLRIPRYGGACPKWVMHRAFLTPGKICRQIGEMNDGSRFFSIAKAVSKPSLGYGQDKSFYSISIGCEISQAKRMVYADGLDTQSPTVAVPIGVACRLCTRSGCAQRAAAPPPKAQTEQPDNWRNISPGIGDT
ncbi:short-chain fatty acyl-CoA regulator family protein [Varunaivibrio sulfuroxidans]|nr:short-chain fatty acyl-CoA regulator family protein [Varunaivibrio sulfuroxidans]